MSFSLEMRNPFLDYRVVEYGLSLDPADLVHKGLSKWVLREAMRDVLPPAIVERPGKQGFTTDEVDWLREGELGSEIETVFRSSTAAARPYFDPDALLTMLASHRAGQQLEFDLWRAFAVERWLRLFIDPPVYQAPVAPSPAVRARDHVTRPRSRKNDPRVPSELACLNAQGVPTQRRRRASRTTAFRNRNHPGSTGFSMGLELAEAIPVQGTRGRVPHPRARRYARYRGTGRCLRREGSARTPSRVVKARSGRWRRPETTRRSRVTT